MKFWKYHAIGNDYLVIESDLSAGQVKCICDRNRGIGADGILVPGEMLRIYNSDGSEAEKSGNGVRIYAKYLQDTGRERHERFEVLTAAGPALCEIRGSAVSAMMGKAVFDCREPPLTNCVMVTIGNPHCVVPSSGLTPELAKNMGPVIECAVPDRTNVQFVEAESRSVIRMEVWERGSGYTLASGTSSCAAAAVMVRLGKCNRDVTVRMPGGDLMVSVAEDYTVTIRGEVYKIAEGELFCA